VKWTADQVLRRLLPAGAEPDFRDPSGTIRVDHVIVPDIWVGATVGRFQQQTGGRIAWIDRLGEGILPTRDNLIQEGDQLHVVMREENANHAYEELRRGPEDH
jgi:trk system potassium uptake protein TrkA